MYIVLHNEQNNYLYLIVKDADGGEAAGSTAQQPAAEAEDGRAQQPTAEAEDGDGLVRN